MADGSLRELDVLVYATGFDPHAYMRPMKVTGVDGVTIDQVWKDRVYSYGGIALPEFPNMFMLYGPFSPVNNVPVPLGLDQEIGFIMKLIDIARRKRVVVAPTAAATEKVRCAVKRGVSANGLGRLPELVLRSAGHAGALAAAARPASVVL